VGGTVVKVGAVVGEGGSTLSVGVLAEDIVAVGTTTLGIVVGAGSWWAVVAVESARHTIYKFSCQA
jgi:hypothetical protein